MRGVNTTPTPDDYEIAREVMASVMATVEVNAENYDKAAEIIRAYVNRMTMELQEQTVEEAKTIGHSHEREEMLWEENRKMRSVLQGILGLGPTVLPSWLHARCAEVLTGMTVPQTPVVGVQDASHEPH